MIRTFAAAALLASFAAPALFVPSAHASGNAPWCAVVHSGRGSVYWDCHYASIEQCQPNVIAGNRGWCNPNPAYEGTVSKPRKTARHHRSKEYSKN